MARLLMVHSQKAPLFRDERRSSGRIFALPGGPVLLLMAAVFCLSAAAQLGAQDSADIGAGPWVSSRLNPPELSSGQTTSLEVLYGVSPDGELTVDRDSIPWYLRLEGSSLSSLYYHDEEGVRRRGALVRLFFKVLAKETLVLDAMRLSIGTRSLETPRILLGILDDGTVPVPTLSWLPGAIPLVEGEETFLLLLSDQRVPEEVRRAFAGGTALEGLELPRDALFIRVTDDTGGDAGPWAPLARYRLIPLKSGRFLLPAFSLELASLGSVRVDALALDVLPAPPDGSASGVSASGRAAIGEGAFPVGHDAAFPSDRPGPGAVKAVQDRDIGSDKHRAGAAERAPFPACPAVFPLLRPAMKGLYERARASYEAGDMVSSLVELRREERSGLLWRQARLLRWQVERDALIGPWEKEASAPLLVFLPLALCGLVLFLVSLVASRINVTIRPGRLLVIGALGLLVMLSALLHLGFVHGGAMGYTGAGRTALSKGMTLRSLPDGELEAEGSVQAGHPLRVRAGGAGWVLVDTGDRRAWGHEEDIVVY